MDRSPLQPPRAQTPAAFPSSPSSYLTFSRHVHYNRQLTSSSLASLLAPTSRTPIVADSTTVPDAASSTSGANCISCTGTNPVCNCAADESCVLTARTCNSCASIQCLPSNKSDTSSKSGNAGIIAGPTVAAVILILLSFGVYYWLRRKKMRDNNRLEAISAAAAHRRSMKTRSRGPSQFYDGQGGFPPLADGGHPPRQPSPRSDVVENSGSSERFPRDVRPSMDGGSFAGVPTLGAHDVGQDRGGEEEGTRRVYSGTDDINVNPYRMTAGQRQSSNNPFDDSRSIATDQMSFGSTNVIPIAFVPSSSAGHGGYADGGNSGAPDTQINVRHNPGAALDAARQEAIGKGMLMPPVRPPRSPDLDLRLRPDDPRPGPDRQQRNSALTARTNYSLAPSFFSGQSEFAALGLDAPQIVTSRQVQVGVRQAAEVVNLNSNFNSGAQHDQCRPQGPQNPDDSVLTNIRSGDPFSDSQGSSGNSSQTHGIYSLDSFGNAESRSHSNYDTRANAQASFLAGQATGQPSTRSLTPMSGHYDAQPSPVGIEFDHRASTSTMGTSRDAVVGSARVVNVGRDMQQGTLQHQPGPSGVQRRPDAPTRASEIWGARESMMSGKSGADSFLGSFPFIPPNLSDMPRRDDFVDYNDVPGRHSTTDIEPKLSTSSPTTPTRDSRWIPKAENSPAFSTAGMSQPINQGLDRTQTRQTMASMASEGLGGFDFTFDSHDAPPLPMMPADEDIDERR